jgi:hypothetical protein
MFVIWWIFWKIYREVYLFIKVKKPNFATLTAI